MRAGKLDRIITIERRDGYDRDGQGGMTPRWVKRAEMRAQLVEANTEEFIRTYGTSDDDIRIFRIRYIPGVETSDRVMFAGEIHNIKSLKIIGRNKGLEIRTVTIKGSQG